MNNSKHKTDTWKQRISKSCTGIRPQKMINKDALKHLIAIRLKNADIAKIFNAGRILVAQCVKFHGLTDFIREPKDDNETTQILREVHQFHQNLGYRCAVGQLQTKGIKPVK